MDTELGPVQVENDTKSDPKTLEMPSSETQSQKKLKESSKIQKQKKGKQRSRSQTPQKQNDTVKHLQVNLKKIEDEEERIEEPQLKMVKASEEGKKMQDKPVEANGGECKEQSKDDKKIVVDNSQEFKVPEVEAESVVEMDPLVISDEPDPELQFDENSDLESGKGSPVVSRCMTRRSQTRNIPTPKTPRLIETDVESDKNSNTPTDLTENTEKKKQSDSEDISNLSTKVEVGSDVTRIDYMKNQSSSLTEDLSYLNSSRERSLGETLRCLSARRPIRSTENYRVTVLRREGEKPEFRVRYSVHDSVEKVVTGGTKRKSRSETPEERKKFKGDSPVSNFFASPLQNIREKFGMNLVSSTPKLLGYKDQKEDLYYPRQNFEEGLKNGAGDKKSWCSIM